MATKKISELDAITKLTAGTIVVVEGGATKKYALPMVIQTHPAAGSSTAGEGNTAIGYGSGSSLNALSTNNTFIGGRAGEDNTDGLQNTFIGSSAGANNTTGNQNTYVGQGAGFDNVNSSTNVGIGYHAGKGIIGNSGTGDNTCIGAAAGNAAAGSTAMTNVFIGKSCAGNAKLTSGYSNVAVGYNAALNMTSGNTNVFVGTGAAFSLTTGSSNVMVGKYAAGYTATSANATTTGAQNVFIGEEAGGASTGQTSNAIAIGYRALVTASNTAVIGNSSITDVYLGSEAANAILHTKQLRIPALNTAPANAGDTGVLGEIRFAADAIYVCTATNTWLKVAIATWS